MQSLSMKLAQKPWPLTAAPRLASESAVGTTESHLQSPAFAARRVHRHLRSHFLRSRPGSRKNVAMVLGGDGRRLDGFNTPAPSLGRSNRVAVCSYLCQSGVLPPRQ